MHELFLKIINMSISASWLVLAVLLLRLLLKKAPKWVNVLLWGIVAVRLLCPVTIESPFSLIPESVSSGQVVSEWMDDYVGESGIIDDDSLHLDSVPDGSAEAVLPDTDEYHIYGSAEGPATVGNAILPVLTAVWGVGVLVLLLYTAISCWLLHRKVATAVVYRDNIFQSEHVDSPFVLGILRPRIYLPFKMNGQDLEHVVAHERAHIRRKDHWWKPLGFLLLTIHWVNPLMWLAYILLCRDIELACDEKVIQDLDNQQRADYTCALLACSVSRKSIAACPLAFGEVGVKDRVKSVMNYRKPAFRVILVAVVVCVIVAVCFLTDPIAPDLFDILYQDGYTVLSQQQVPLTLRISKDALPDSVYTSEGHTFKPGEVVAYQSDSTTIYLSYAMLSNESDELMYFTFDFSYDFLDYGSFLSSLAIADEETDSMSHDLILNSKALKDAAGSYPDALDVRGYGPGSQFAFYVSTQACNDAEEMLLIDIICPQIFYTKAGFEDEAAEALADEITPKEVHITAQILEIHNGYFLVDPENTGIFEKISKLSVPMVNMDASPEPQVGDTLAITCNGVMQEAYPHRLTEVYEIRVIEELVLPKLRRMVIVDSILYLDTGIESTSLSHSGIMLRVIESTVDSDQIPNVSGQSNFGIGYMYHAGPQDGTIEVNVDGTWRIFATEEVRLRLQFPDES